jgi:hypothetical protein
LENRLNSNALSALKKELKERGIEVVALQEKDNGTYLVESDDGFLYSIRI